MTEFLTLQNVKPQQTHSQNDWRLMIMVMMQHHMLR